MTNRQLYWGTVIVVGVPFPRQPAQSARTRLGTAAVSATVAAVTQGIVFLGLMNASPRDITPCLYYGMEPKTLPAPAPEGVR